MTTQENEKVIHMWIDPGEWVTVRFRESPDLNAEVPGCTGQAEAIFEAQ